MAITTAQVKDLLLPGLNKIFGDYKQLPTQYTEIFDVGTSDKAYERDVEIALFNLAQQRAEGASTNFADTPGERYMYTYRHVQISLGFIMTRNAIRDNLYKAQFNPSAAALKAAMRRTKETMCANVLNNATDSTNYPGGDGVSLLNTAHPIDTGTVSNTAAVQAEFSETSLQDALIAIRRFRDAAGALAVMKAGKIIIPPELEFPAKRVLGAQLRVGTSDNDPNAVRQLFGLDYTINDYLTNTKSWYIKTDAEEGLKYFQRDPLESDMHTDFVTDNLLTKATERFSAGWSNFRGIYGCMP